MCGQFGIVTGSKRDNHGDDFIRDSFTASMLRGEDSSGLASIDLKLAQYVVHKLPIAGNFFAEDTLAKTMILDACSSDTLTMGHVRAATVGKISVSNAHPFEIYRDGRALIGTHNGTLTGWQSKKDARSFTVDSEWALNLIFEDGLDAFEQFSGAYSFVWWDTDDHDVINMARNKERPMCIAFLENGGMAYASEPGMLYWILERRGMKIDGKILILDEDKLYKFNRKALKEFKTYTLPKFKYQSVSYTNTYNNTTRNYSLTTVEKVEALIKKTTAVVSMIPNGPVVSEQEVRTARDYGWLDMDCEFTPITDNGREVRGIAECASAELDAIIRGNCSELSMDDTWKCRVIGVLDNDKDVELILSTPYKTTAPVMEPLT